MGVRSCALPIFLHHRIRHRSVPVVTAHAAEQGLRIAEALAEGGLPVAEITFRTDAAPDAIAEIAARGEVLVGAGTVLRPDQVDRAVAAGATFVVSPGTSSTVIDRCSHHGIPVLPGSVTATEIQTALDAGITTVQFFPAEASAGPAKLSAPTDTFVHLPFAPTRGTYPATSA